IAAQLGHGYETLKTASQSPAGKEWKQRIREMTEDIPALVAAEMSYSQPEMYSMWLVALEAAHRARDYKTVHTMMRDIGLVETMKKVKPKDENKPNQTFVFNVDSGDMAALRGLMDGGVVEVEWEEQTDDEVQP
ncbi:MAG: hypothetical protein R3268_13815, partial [Acidiferrobacterales bacterium]|nr:hypothetical protein [Acidiferrobacterales bacterium]